MPYRVAADVMLHVLPIDAGKSPKTSRSHTLQIGKQLADATAQTLRTVRVAFRPFGAISLVRSPPLNGQGSASGWRYRGIVEARDGTVELDPDCQGACACRLLTSQSAAAAGRCGRRPEEPAGNQPYRAQQRSTRGVIKLSETFIKSEMLVARWLWTRRNAVKVPPMA
jgi:hypothetical protein